MMTAAMTTESYDDGDYDDGYADGDYPARAAITTRTAII